MEAIRRIELLSILTSAHLRMRTNPSNRFLRSEATGLADGGGATPPAAAAAPSAPAVAPAVAPDTATPAVPAAAAPVAPPAAAASAPRAPSRLEMIQAAVRDKSVIIAENNGFKSEITALKGNLADRDTTISTLNQRIKALETENGNLQADFSKIDAALKTTEAKVVSVDTAAARVVATMGIDPITLPAAETDKPSVEVLIAKMNATTDSAEKYKLAAQINEMEAKI